MAHGNGTAHHKLHGLVGWGFIIGLPFAAFSALRAVGGGADGFTAWLSNPVGGLGFLAFLTAALWYCKLEFDEVIMDYFGGSLRQTCLLLNRIAATIVWLLAAFAVIKLAFLGA